MTRLAQHGFLMNNFSFLNFNLSEAHMPNLDKILQILPKIFLGVLVTLFVLQVVGFFVIFYLSSQALK